MNTAAIAAASAAAGIALMMGLRDWRRSVYWLLLYLPFAGVPTIVLYPAPEITRVLKDIYFVVPAYLGFVAWAMKHGGLSRFRPEARPVLLLCGLFVLVVLVQSVNPRVGSIAVVGVGIKTWLFYMPFLVLGFHLVATTTEVERVFRWMLVAGFVPVLLGIAQSLLLGAGRGDLAYGLYGPAAHAISQGFSTTRFAAGGSGKAPGVFTFVTQYYNFLLVMIAISFTVALARRKVGRPSALYFGFAGVASLAAFLSGSRGVFVTVPLLLGVAGVLAGNAAIVIQTVGITAAALTVAALTFGTTVRDLGAHITPLLFDYLFVTPAAEFHAALRLGYWGMGTGYNTGPARLATSDGESMLVVENYFAKGLVELGVVGLLLLVLVMAVLLAQAAAAIKKIHDPQMRRYGLGVLAFLVISVLNFWKGSYLDIDPLNVYFWLLAGVLFRLPTVATSHAAAVRPDLVAVRYPPRRAQVRLRA